MYQKPNPLIQKLISDLQTVKQQILEINNKIEDPELFKNLQKQPQKDK